MRTRTWFKALLVAALAGLWALPGTAASLEARDDAGHAVTLEQPARRIISLAPHATELLFAIGAGERIVGAVDYSDYPPAASAIARVGSFAALDYERILALKPDLVVGWQSGSGAAHLAKLRTLGLTLFISEPRELEDIATNMERLGTLTGLNANAREAARRFRNERDRLARAYSGKAPVTVFYQIWDQPLLTVGGLHVISQVIALCGGRNIFAELGGLAPNVQREDVLRRDPQAIVAGGMSEARPTGLEQWRRWPQLRAVKHHHLFVVPADLMHRPTPRLLEGAAQVCADLDEVRTEHQRP